MTINTFYQLTRADFLQRVRGSGFFIMVVLTVYLSYIFVPSPAAKYAAVLIGSYRLVYNSAGIGLMFGIIISLFLSLFTFYLVKNSVERDRNTHVGQIIATTPTQTVTYLVGKWGSNLLLLAVLVAIMTLMAPMMQWLRGESAVFDFWQLVLPIWLIGLPVMSLVAGTAVLFETIPFLRGGLGNVAYFFLWAFIMTGIAMFIFESGKLMPDPFGISQPVNQIFRQVTETNAAFQTDLTIIGEKPAGGYPTVELLKTSWSATAVLWRVVWLFVGAGFAALGALPFDRFNPANARSSQPGIVARYWQTRQDKRQETAVRNQTSAPTNLSRLAVQPNKFRFGSVLLAELKLSLKGQAWWWYAGTVGFIIYGLVQPLATSTSALMIAMIWPVLVWSALGARENQHRTMMLITSTPRSLWRQIPAAWLSGVVVSLMVLAGFMLNASLSGAWLPLIGLFTGALFVPALALALGVLSGTSRLFEIVYLVWWYLVLNLGNDNSLLNYIPTTNINAIPLYLVATGLLLVVALIGRRVNKTRFC